MTKNLRNTLVCLALVLVMLGLGGCSSKEKNKWTIDGKEVVLNQSENTITYDDQVYHYTKSNTQIQITYPNQMVYSEMYNGSSVTSSSWAMDINEDATFIDITTYGYLSERTIIDVVLKYSREIDPSSGFSLSGRSPLLGLFIVFLGAIVILFPKASWYLNYGWRYKDSEPTKVAITVQRVSGGIAVVVGLFLIFAS